MRVLSIAALTIWVSVPSARQSVQRRPTLPRRRRAHLRQRRRPRRQRQHRPQPEEGRLHPCRRRQDAGDHGVRLRGGAVGGDSGRRAGRAGAADPQGGGGAKASGGSARFARRRRQARFDRSQESAPHRAAVRFELDAARGARAGDGVRARLRRQAADARRSRRDCVDRLVAADRPGLHGRPRDAVCRARSLVGSRHGRVPGGHDADRRRDRRRRLRRRRQRVQHLQHRPAPRGHRAAVRRARADSAEEVDRLLQQRRDAARRRQPGPAARRPSTAPSRPTYRSIPSTPAD